MHVPLVLHSVRVAVKVILEITVLGNRTELYSANAVK